MIGEFLPYNIQFQLIEDRYNPITRTKCFQSSALTAFVCKIIKSPSFSLFVNRNQLSRDTHWLSTIQSGAARLNIKYLREKMLFFIYEMKKRSPKHALILLKEMSILIDPKKKYKTSREIIAAI
jgi:hypothetical protein